MAYLKQIFFCGIVLCGVAGAVWAQDNGDANDRVNEAAEKYDTQQLRGEADSIKAEIQTLQGGIEQLNKELGEADEKAAAEIKKKLQAERKKIRAKADELQEKISQLKKRGAKVEDLQLFVTKATGEVKLENVNATVAVGLLAEWATAAKNWLFKSAPGWFFKILIFLAIMLLFRVLSRVAGKVTRAALDTKAAQFSDLLETFFVQLVRKLTMLLGLLIALQAIGVDIGPFLAGVGVAGFVIGFALKDTLSNFASGLMILGYQPYDVGNVIDAGGVKGKVESMNLVSTTILTPDNQVMIVPNNKIWGGVITNVTARDRRRVDFTFGIGYEDDIDKAEEVLRGIVTEHGKIHNDPAPVIKLHALGESSVDFVVRVWTATGDYWDVHWDLTRAVKDRFDRAGISIPFPQRDLHIVSEPDRTPTGAPGPVDRPDDPDPRSVSAADIPDHRDEDEEGDR